MSNQSSVERLVDQALQQTSGPLYTAMQLLIQDLYRGYNQLFPATPLSQRSIISGALDPQAVVTNFVVVIQPTNIHLTWSQVDAAARYEIRIGDDWDTATFLVQTHSLQTDISPFTIPLLYGTYNFLIKAIDPIGTYSNAFTEVTIDLPRIQRPTITSTVIGNNVLLKWTEPASLLQIDHYNIYSNDVLVGQVRATFDVIFEQVGGNYSFTVEAVDIVGNIGLPSTDVLVTLGNPIDFSFFASHSSTLNGTLINTVLDTDGTLFAPSTDDTYEAHFTDNSYANWQDPIDAGFPLYFEPSDVLVGTYEEICDFGTIIPNTVVGIDFNTTRLVGSVSIAAEISVSDDNITYDTPVSGTSRFAASVRYAKIKLTFTAANNKSSINIFNLRCLLSVRKETDGGSLSVVSGGTHVTYNKTFLAIDAITITVSSNNSYFAAYVLDTPATAGFTVYVFDATGTPIGANVSWVARGVIA